MDTLNKIGVVYLITNKINGKKYVGQTIRDINNRLDSHFRHAKYYSNKNKNRPLFNSMMKYGRNNFDIIVLKECDSILMMDECEKSYIKKLNTIHPNGYNLGLGGNGQGKTSDDTKMKLSARLIGNQYALGYRHTQEFKDYMSNKNKGNTNTLGMITSDKIKDKLSLNSPSRKEIYQLDLSGNTIRKWQSISSASRHIDKIMSGEISKNTLKRKANIIRCLNGVGGQSVAYGYRWKFVSLMT